METSKNNKTLRTVYFILLGLFALIAIWRIYNYLQGTESLHSIGIPVSFLMVLTASLIGKDRSPALYYILVGAGFILVIASLVLMFVN